MRFTPTEAIKAIDARIDGDWDNVLLHQLKPLTDILEDIKRIIKAADEMPVYHLFTVKYIPQSNFKPQMLRIKSERYGKSITVSDQNAIDYLNNKGYNIVAEAEGHLNRHGIKPIYLLSDTFKPFTK